MVKRGEAWKRAFQVNVSGNTCLCSDLWWMGCNTNMDLFFTTWRRVSPIEKTKSAFILKQFFRVTLFLRRRNLRSAAIARLGGNVRSRGGGWGQNHITAACGYVVTLVGPLLMWLETPHQAIINIDPVPFFTLESILRAWAAGQKLRGVREKGRLIWLSPVTWCAQWLTSHFPRQAAASLIFICKVEL